MTTATHSRNALKHLLLDMISTTRTVDVKAMAALGDGDWQIICEMARQHRLGPILHHHFQTIGADWVVPENVRERCASTFKRSALRSLSIRQGLAKLDVLLNAASIPYAALKGAWLSQHAYPHPALRPMRDVDIIVPIDLALVAFNMLIEAGYSRRPGDAVPLEYALENYKHLPTLSCPVSNCSIEVHSRLIGELPPGDLSGTILDTEELLARRIHEVKDGTEMTYLSPTDTLLHLIVHSAYYHRFNNGPLVLNDIAAILLASEIERDRFWLMADACSWTRGCQLLFAMTKSYHDQIDEPVTDTVMAIDTRALIDPTALLTLTDFDEFSAVSFRKELLGKFWSRKIIKYLWNKAIPERFVLASFAGLPLESKRVWAHYPIWLVVRCRQVIFRRLGNDLHADAERAALVEHWLQRSV